MSKIQIWQVKGLGTDRKTVKTVLRTFARDGVQGIESQQALVNYIEKLSDDSLRDMYEIDSEATIQIMVDCFGAAKAFQKFVMVAEGIDIDKEELKRAGWVSPEEYAEVVKKYEERTKKLNEGRDRVLLDYERAAQKAEEAEEKIFYLKEEMVHLKADLYDLYAEAGKLPGYERR